MNILDSAIVEQVRTLFGQLSSRFVFRVRAYRHPKAEEMIAFVKEVAACSDNISVETMEVSETSLEFSLVKEGEETGISFRGIPSGHEFTSLLLAVLNAEGKGKNLPDAGIERRIRALNVPVSLRTYVSLTCTNCPDVVQALNVLSLYHPQIRHEMVDGALFTEEVERLKIQAVPSVYANGELLHTGRGSLGELLQELEERLGSRPLEASSAEVHDYDVLVVGGGPAGSSSAIYSARKGLKVAIIAERIGGQVKETVGIENLISVPKTTGARLAEDLRLHIEDYPVDVFENRRIENAELRDNMKRIDVSGGEVFRAPEIIIATGASWRKLNVPGEAEYIGKGVAFCPHCDGPLFKDRKVAVVGGGNSGIEAAIDLAGICSSVTVLEFADSLKADKVLVEKAGSLPNVEIFTNMATQEVLGDGSKVTSIRVMDRVTKEERVIPLDGIFVQIGLAANSVPFKEQLEVTRIGEIKIDEYCRTSLPGVYAAGDVSNVPYKQIVIAMGEGAKAALSAFDDRIRGVIAS